MSIEATSTPLTHLFEPFAFAKGVELRNRIVMAPMTTWSGNRDGTVSHQELAYYRRRSKGAGMIITGCTHVTENGIGFQNEFAAHNDCFIPSLRHLAESAKSGGGKAILQIFHAGNKAVPELIADGDLVSASQVKASPGPFNSGERAPRALSGRDIADMIEAFGLATRRAIEAGFDGVELHGAHGFLIQNFLSPRYNRRQDSWGGSLENRMRFPLALVEEVNRVIDRHANQPFLVGYRLSPEESDPGGLRMEETLALADRLADSRVDYLHVSLSNLLEDQPGQASDGVLTVEQFIERVNGRIPVMAAGGLRTPEQASRALDLGLPLIAVGKGLVMNADWVSLAEQGRQDRIRTELPRDELRRIGIPDNLRKVIAAKSGWFPIKDDGVSA
ncbi:NADH-dependent flavin oxidoreductase [Marinobacter bohaiensis]|uniref:NADH-dependent flavin oxidoreductase n=1 Tax=Marinobacter bohaiensis TaxID=2201898 RepID=UPI000DAE5BC6|nr:NADH-dependent flavin oxidoreductase [Marinobacter bohaiensis]